jgi:cell division protein FtsW
MKDSRSWILIIVASLMGLSLVFISSVKPPCAIKQAIWMAIGLLAMFAFWFIDYRLYYKYWKPLLFLTTLILGLVLIPGVGSVRNGARRWIFISGFSIQPSEFAKIGIVFGVAGYLAQYQKQLKSLLKGFIPVMGGVCFLSLLVALEPDVGTAGLIGMVSVIMLCVGGVRKKHMIPATVISGVGLTAFLSLLGKYDYLLERVKGFLDPLADPLKTGFQPLKSLECLGSGGLWGVGIGQGHIKNLHLPEAHTDFILSVIGEELGLAGTLLVVVLFVALMYQGMKIAQTAPDRFGFFTVLGLSIFIGLQAAINVAVVTVSMPTKGISLPLITYGGSSVVATMISIGIIMSVARAGDSIEERDREFKEMVAEPEDSSRLTAQF